MSFIKHIGKHADRKVAIIYRVVPGEEHMALVCYPDTLPKAFHNGIMSVIESDPGQQAENLADALHRNLLSDGRQILETLHREGMIKKVRTKDIVVTPNATSHVHLDELNKIMDGIGAGDEAAKKMADLDKNTGLVDPSANRAPMEVVEETVDAGDTVDYSDMSDTGIAKQRMQQSKNLVAEAKALNAEAKRLKEEAYDLDATLRPKTRKKAPVPKKKAIAKKKSPAKKIVKKAVKKATKKSAIVL